jgi:hypothetical protein
VIDTLLSDGKMHVDHDDLEPYLEKKRRLSAIYGAQGKCIDRICFW